MQQGAPLVTNQQIFDEALSYLGRGSYFQTTAYDTHLRIGNFDSYDIFHHFELFGRKILWINQVQEEVAGDVKTRMPRTIFPCSQNDFDGHIVAHRFASVLCFVMHGTFINPRLWVGTAFPVASTSQPAEKYVGMLCDHEQIDSSIQRLDLDSFTEKRWVAMANYRQANLAATPYYQILSYWKILETYFNNSRKDINKHIDDLYSTRPDAFHYVGEFTGKASKKLRDIRNASAHFMLDGDTTLQDPDNPDVFNEADKGIFVLRRLSEGLIERSEGW